jgi:hypothetical protein
VPTRTRPEPLPEPLPEAASDLDFDWRRELRQVADLWRLIVREMRWAFGHLGRELSAVGRAVLDPATSRAALIGIVRGLNRANILYGAVLAVIVPLVGGSERAWQILLTVTVVSIVIEMVLGGNWLGGTSRPKKVSLVKQPHP